MIPLFIGLTAFNLICLCATAALGYCVMLYGSSYGPLHQLAGVLATIACCAVHCIVFTYFIATAKWMQHAVEVKHLEPAMLSPTKSFKMQAFPAALIAMGSVFLAAVVGAITFSYGVRSIYHHAIALTAIAVNAGVAIVEYRAIVRNGKLVDAILEQINGPAKV